MSDQDIINLGKAITDFGVAHQAKMNQLDAARINANDAAEEALAVQSIGNRVRIYVDPINGDDSLDGKVSARAVKTWAAACDLMRSGFGAEVFISSDLNLDSNVTMNAPPSNISLRSSGGVHKYIIVDAVNHNTYPGGINCQGNLVVATLDADVVMAHTRTAVSPISVSGHLVARCKTTTISRTGTGSPLFDGNSSHFEVVNTVIDASASGHVISGVAAGGDPNAINGISANFTQA